MQGKQCFGVCTSLVAVSVLILFLKVNALDQAAGDAMKGIGAEGSAVKPKEGEPNWPECHKVNLPNLPYTFNSLAPAISEETVTLHYTKHQAGYVTKLNEWLQGTYRSLVPYNVWNSLVVSLILAPRTEKPILNLAGQIYNHALYFGMLSGKKEDQHLDLHDPFAVAIQRSFESLDGLKAAVKKEALSHFGSGWVFLVENRSALDHEGRPKLSLFSGHDAATPLNSDRTLIPLLVVDVWEHAYYVDTRNDRGKYFDHWWSVIGWRYVSDRYSAGEVEFTRDADGCYPQMRRL